MSVLFTLIWLCCCCQLSMEFDFCVICSQSSMTGGGGGAVSLVAFNEMKDALIAINQLQAENLASLQRKADVSDLKAERAKADKDSKSRGSILRWRCWRRPCMALLGATG